MKAKSVVIGALLFLIIHPTVANAQIAQGMKDLHEVLDSLYTTMMPMCRNLINVGMGIGGIAALFYIAVRIWKHLANAEPIDFYPLFRPFVLGFCIINFPLVLQTFNGVLKPIERGTASMVDNSKKALEAILEQREKAIRNSEKWRMYIGNSGKGDRDLWYETKFEQSADDETWYKGLTNSIAFTAEKEFYKLTNAIKVAVSEILTIAYEAAALCINAIRTFQLIVLSILGPLVFALGIFDGLQQTIKSWIARYINIFLWVPVANIFGSILAKVQEEMFKRNLPQIGQADESFFSTTDIAYYVFMLIGIVGYFTVPSIANYIVQAGSSTALNQKAGAVGGAALSNATGMAGSIAAGVTSQLRERISGFNK